MIETIILFPFRILQPLLLGKFFGKGYCTPLLGILWRGLLREPSISSAHNK